MSLVESIFKESNEPFFRDFSTFKLTKKVLRALEIGREGIKVILHLVIFIEDIVVQISEEDADGDAFDDVSTESEFLDSRRNKFKEKILFFGE